MDYKLIPTSLKLPLLPLQAPESWNYRQQPEPPQAMKMTDKWSSISNPISFKCTSSKILVLNFEGIKEK